MASSYAYYTPGRYGTGSLPLVTYPSGQSSPGAALYGGQTGGQPMSNIDTRTLDQSPMIGGRESTKFKWSWVSLGCSIFSIIFCNLGGLLCGTVAMAMALLGYSDHKTNSLDDAKYKNRWALILAILAILFGSICIILVAVLPMVFDIKSISWF